MKKTPLIILHGWGLNNTRFAPLVSVLKQKKYSVLCPDLPGFGKTQKPKKSLYLDDYIKYVLDFLKKNKIAKANFICHSFGGRIGIKLTVQNPEKVNSLILTGVPGLMPVPRIKVVFFYYLAKAGKLVFSLPFISLFNNFAQKLIYSLANANDFYNTRNAMRETFQNIVKENLAPYLPQITPPTLLLWGRNDTFVSPQIAIKMAKIIPNNKLIILDNISHGFPYSHPEIFTQNLEKFLNNA